MIQSILVPVDFSSNSATALAYAHELANTLSAKIKVVHVLAVQLCAESKADLDQKLHEFVRSVIDESHDPQQVSIKIIEGDSILALHASGLTSECDLVIMGTRGQSDRNTDLVGSNTINLLNVCNKPMIIIPEDNLRKEIKTISFFSDYNDLDIDHSLYALKEIAISFQARLKIVHIKTNENTPDPHHVVESRREGKFFTPEVQPHFRTVMAKNVFDGINYYLDLKGDNDLVVLVNRKHNFFDRLFKTNNTQKMAYHTNVPLLVVPE